MRPSTKLICGYLTTVLSVTTTLSTATLAVTLAVTLAMTAPSSAQAADYCLALRGNGEAQPAHWGALASVVEKMGLPRIQAGGSSATISMFLLDSLASNPWIADASVEEQSRRASLLLKSFTGITLYIAQTPSAKAGIDLYSSYKAAKKLGDKIQLLKQVAMNPSEAKGQTSGLAKALYEAGLGQTPRYRELIKSLHTLSTNPTQLSLTELQRIRFYSAELYQAITTLGAFDAESDSTLLFRDGIVDFKAFGSSIGKIASFLAETDFEVWGSKWEREHAGLTWQEFVTRHPSAQSELFDLLTQFFARPRDWTKNNVVMSSAGQSIASLPTTSVLTGAAYEKAKSVYDRYHSNLDRNVALEFKVDDINDVRFGYWGIRQILQKASTNLRRDYANDFKSSRFLALGEASWQDVLSLSPAEQGLASLQKMTVNGKPAFSAGGWSDLHPIPVLKAAGCQTVVYVTRKGGESLFGQGIAKRVFGFDRSWEVLRTKTPENVKANELLNDVGDPNDLTSVWAKLYNVANPQSSYMVSVAKADVILCTDWNKYDVKSQIDQLVTESYHAPFLTRSSSVADELKAKGAQFISDPFASSAGRPLWVGCRAPR